MEAAEARKEFVDSMSSEKGLLDYPRQCGIEAIKKKPLKFFGETDSDNAKRLAYYFGNLLKYDGKGWRVWHGDIWKQDNQDYLTWFARQIHKIVLREKTKANGSGHKQMLDKLEQKVQSTRGVVDMIRLLPSEENISIAKECWDANKDLLNCENGIYHFSSGTLTPHNASDLITKKTRVAFDAKADCPNWRDFMNQIMMNDTELVDYIQEVAGYSLTAETQERCMFILQGNGKNGKSTFLNILREMMGYYGQNIPAQTLIAKNGFFGINNDLARMENIRLATGIETDEGQNISEALIKQLTGGKDPITARKLYEEFEQFFPVMKLFIMTNHLLGIKGVDDGIWDRIRIIPFNARFDGAVEDKDLYDKLWQERSGILNWALVGYKRYKERGCFKMPAVLDDIKSQYRQEQDVVGDFLSSYVEHSLGCHIKSGDLYEAFKEWCDNSCVDPMAKNIFSSRVAQKGYKRGKNKKYRYWEDVKIK